MSTTADLAQRTPLYRFWQPRYWILWIGLGLLRLAVFLPVGAQLYAGRRLGDLGFYLIRKRRRIAETNLRLCFPQLDSHQRRRLLRRHFQSLGMSLFEMAMGAWASDARLNRRVTIRGIEHLREALQQGHGAVLLSAHLPAQEVCGRVLIQHLDAIAALYRTNENALVDELLRRIRGRTTSYLIPKDNMRQMLRALRQGVPVWYACDQSYRRKGAVLAPFFGEPAMTASSLSDIARISRAPVVPYFTRRVGNRYELDILPALEDFPGDDPEADTRRINRLLESHVRDNPEQYYWVHRRFKGRPDEYPDPYASPDKAEQ